LDRFETGGGVFDDPSTSNRGALLKRFGAPLAARGFARRVVVGGEMLERGPKGPDLHRQCGREIAATGVDVLIGVRGLASELVAGAIETSAGVAKLTSFCETPEEAAEMLIAGALPGDLILVKGSRGVRMEKVVERLKTAFGSANP